MAKTVEELLQENNDLLRQQQSRGGGGGGGGDGTATKQGFWSAAFDKGAAGVSKLAAGTATTSDVLGVTTGVISKLGGVGEKSAMVLQDLGAGAINVNNTLKDTGKFGVTFGQNLGEANLAIKSAQLTLPEFQSMIQQSGKSLAGLSGGQNESAKTFLKLSSEMQGLTVAQDLKAAGMSSQELNDVLLLTSKNSFKVNMDDANSRKEAILAATSMANEMNKVADLTGKSRKQQEDEIKRIQDRADVEAAVLLAQKSDPNFGKNMDAATQAMSRFGPKVQELLAEEATGGARSDDALNTKAALGPAAEAIRAYGKALESGDKDLIAEAKKKAEIAVAERVNSEEFLKTAKVTQGNTLNMGSLVHDSFTYQKNIAAEQEELAKQGKEATKEAAEASLAAKNQARTQGLTTDPKTGKPIVDEGAVVGRTINQIDNLGKVVGGSMAIGFNKLNTELGHTIATQLPNFNAKLKSLGTPEALNKAAGGVVSEGVDSAASALGVRKIPTDANTRDLLNKGPISLRKNEETPAAGSDAAPGAPSSNTNNNGILNEFKDFFSQLNTKMGNIEMHTKATADSANKQVKATENLSGNRL